MRTYLYGRLSAVGRGVLNGRNLEVNYVNYVNVPGRMQGIVSPDGSQMNVTDYGSGYPQNILFYR
jgi:hypothetical protein